MIDALTEILSGTGLSLVSTDATNIELNIHQSRQTTKERLIQEILSYTDHIGYEDGSNFVIVDKLLGVDSTAILRDRIVSVSATLESLIINRFEIDLLVKEFQKQDNGTPSLVDKIVTKSVSTGQSGGDVQKVSPLSQPTTLSSGEIVYYYDDITTVLNRKKDLYLLDDITLTVKGFQELKYGDKITFTEYNKYKTDDIASGYLVVTGFSYNQKNLTTTMKGIGEYNIL